MKKILMISYHFPPEEGSCSDKNIKILKVLKDEGFHVDVLTVGVLSKNEKFYDCSIFRVRGGIFHRNKNNNSCKEVNGKTIHKGKEKKIKNFVQRNIIPDPIIDWYSNVLKWADYNKNEMKEYDLIFSISSPYSCHIISRSLSKKYNIPYISSYGDPWIYEPTRKRGKIRYWLEYQMEKRVVTDAEKILVITDYNKQKYLNLYHIPTEKIDVFNIGYDKSTIKKYQYNNKDAIRFIYGGSLNPIHRNPIPFLTAVKKQNNINVDIYNQDFSGLSEILQEYEIDDRVKLHKLISYHQFNDELYKSDVLILFGNKTVFQVPGKIFEYISTGIHIFYIKNNSAENDGSENILKKYGNVTIVENNEERIFSELNNIYEKYRLGKLNSVCYKEEFEFHVTMKSIVDSVNNVCNKESSWRNKNNGR